MTSFVLVDRTSNQKTNRIWGSLRSSNHVYNDDALRHEGKVVRSVYVPYFLSAMNGTKLPTYAVYGSL